jgi:hypothetical protein
MTHQYDSIRPITCSPKYDLLDPEHPAEPNPHNLRVKQLDDLTHCCRQDLDSFYLLTAQEQKKLQARRKRIIRAYRDGKSHWQGSPPLSQHDVNRFRSLGYSPGAREGNFPAAEAGVSGAADRAHGTERGGMNP